MSVTMRSTRETWDAILHRIARIECTPCELAFWRTPAGIRRFRSYMPDSDDSSTAGSETCSDDAEENPRQTLLNAPRITPATLASTVSQPPAASSLLRQTRDAHLQSPKDISADIAASIASPFAQAVSMSDAQNQDALHYSQRILREEIQRGGSQSPAKGPNGERMRADDQPMDAANLEYEELATQNVAVRLPTQAAAELHFQVEFR